MPEFRAASGLVSVQPYMRTLAGLMSAAPVFFGTGGPVDAGGTQPLTAVTSPDTVSGAVDHPGATPATTNAAGVVASGGVPPYSYSWSSVAGWTVLNPTGASSAFRCPVGPGASVTDDFTCTVTDARGQTATTNAVTATVSNFGA